jgi:hypothetical protein
MFNKIQWIGLIIFLYNASAGGGCYHRSNNHLQTFTFQPMVGVITAPYNNLQTFTIQPMVVLSPHHYNLQTFTFLPSAFFCYLCRSEILEQNE